MSLAATLQIQSAHIYAALLIFINVCFVSIKLIVEGWINHICSAIFI